MHFPSLLPLALPALSLASSLPAHTLAQLPLGTWLENITPRRTGALLITQMAPSAVVFTLDPANPSLQTLVEIPSIQNIYGIAPVEVADGRETYLFVGGNSTALADPVAGEFSAWTLTFEPGTCGENVVARKVSDMSPHSLFLNGVASIPTTHNAVLVADSFAGTVGRLDVATGAYDAAAFALPQMVAPADNALGFGVNGVRVRSGYLYWTNSALVSIFRMRITATGYPAHGASAELVANASSVATFVDDFTFDGEGNIYAASNIDNTVVYIDVKTGEMETVVGGKDLMTVAGSTSMAFGRDNSEILYVTTSGALADPVDGNKTEGAKVVAVDTRG